MPITRLVSVVPPLIARATPKSMTRGPSGPRSTLWGLKSRWTIFAWWIADRAVAVPTASRSRAAPPSGPFSSTCWFSDGPGTYSLTM